MNYVGKFIERDGKRIFNAIYKGTVEECFRFKWKYKLMNAIVIDYFPNPEPIN